MTTENTNAALPNLHDHVRHLEKEVHQLRQGILSDAIRGRLAYHLHLKSDRRVDMRTARKVVDSAVTDALESAIKVFKARECP